MSKSMTLSPHSLAPPSPLLRAVADKRRPDWRGGQDCGGPTPTTNLVSAIPDRALPALHGLLDAPYHAACPFSAAIPSLEDARRCEDLLRPIAMELAGTGPQLTGWAAGGHKCISPFLLCFLILSKVGAFFWSFFLCRVFLPPPPRQASVVVLSCCGKKWRVWAGLSSPAASGAQSGRAPPLGRPRPGRAAEPHVWRSRCRASSHRDPSLGIEPSLLNVCS